ncbi:otoancorin-like isoform X1 [Narcine bancroftii]|uniref:otoancorin-like isoform X1 n=1 Tax=Narcine bancroftii TaxID=1343680 RepID=UPI003831EBB4
MRGFQVHVKVDKMGLKCHAVVFVLFVYLIGRTTVVSQGSGEDPKERSGRCHGWEVNLRNHLSAAGHVMDYLTTLNKSISTLSPGCVRSFNLNVSLSNLMEIMKVFNEEYDNLIPGTRKQIYKWTEDIYTKGSGPFGMNTMVETNDKGPDHKGNRDQDKGKGKGHWITLDALKILGRFVVQAPTSTFKAIAQGETSTICQLLNSSSRLLDQLFDLTLVQAHILFQGLYTCDNVYISEPATIDKLGQLACFYPAKKLKLLKEAAVIALRNKLLNCTRNVKEIYRILVENINANSLTAEGVKELGASVVGLNVSELSSISKEAIAGALSELKNVKGWSKSQIAVLVNKYKAIEEVKAENLNDLGVLVSGVGVKTFEKFKGQQLRFTFSQKDVAETTNAMLPVQQKSIMERILETEDINFALYLLPGPLLTTIPVDKLKQAKNISVELLSQNKLWNLGQSIVLINLIEGELKNPENISKLKTAVKGMSCNLIKSLKLDAVRAVATNPHASIDQIRCSTNKFSQLEYFRTIMEGDIDEFLASYIIFAQYMNELRKIPQSLCSNVVEVISQANISVLPKDSDRLKEIFKYAMECQNSNVSLLTEDQGIRLGSLVCQFSAADIKSLNTTVFLAIVSQFRVCRKFSEEMKNALREQILSSFPSLPNWTVDECILLDSLLTVLTKDDLQFIPNNEEIRLALEQILSSHKPARDFIPPGLDTSADFSSLRWKFFKILTQKTDSKKRKHALDSTAIPTLDNIEPLGEANSQWTVDQLDCMSVEDFINSLDTLTEVTSFSSKQLQALKAKALQAYGININNYVLASLKKITLGFNDEEVQKYFTKPDIDNIGAISEYKEWAKAEYSSRANTIVNNFISGRAYNHLSSTELVGLGYFICTFTSDQIKSINNSAYSSAAKDIGNKMCPNFETLVAFKKKAVQVFGSVDKWTGAELQEIGIAAAALNAEEIIYLMTSAVPFLTQLAVSRFPPKVFSAMTNAQLRNLGIENYGAVTEKQKAALSISQLNALNENVGIARMVSGAGSIHWSPVITLTLLVLSLTMALH